MSSNLFLIFYLQLSKYEHDLTCSIYLVCRFYKQIPNIDISLRDNLHSKVPLHFSNMLFLKEKMIILSTQILHLDTNVHQKNIKSQRYLIKFFKLDFFCFNVYFLQLF